MIDNKNVTVPVPPVDADGRQPLAETNVKSIADAPAEINNFGEISEEMCRQRQRMNDPAYLHTVSMSELYENVYQSRPPIIDGLLHPGTYLFVGAPKVGKSFLMAQLAYHVSTGLPLWDYPVRKGTVLYLALEDDYRRLQERLFRMYGTDSTENLHFATGAKQLGGGLDEQLRKFTQEHPDTKLVIVDTLQKVREAGGDSYSYANDYVLVGRLKQFADHAGLCLLLVHHTRKQQADDNAKQKRQDRVIPNYYEHIQKRKQEKLFHEVVFQVGNVRDMAVGTPEGEQAKMLLGEYMESFRERNPHLRVFAAHLHMDEATPHLHIDFVPFTTGSKRGLDTRVSMKKALAAQGFAGGSREDTELNQWINSEKVVLSQVMERHGIEWEQKGTHKEHLSVLDFKKQERQAEVKALEKSIKKLQQQEVDIQEVESITAKNVPLSTKVMLEQEDFKQVMAAAKKYVVQARKENKLERLLKAANKTVAELKAQVAELTRELAPFRSIHGKLQSAKLEQENKELKQKNSFYRDIIERNSLSHLLVGQREPRRQQGQGRESR